MRSRARCSGVIALAISTACLMVVWSLAYRATAGQRFLFDVDQAHSMSHSYGSALLASFFSLRPENDRQSGAEPVQEPSLQKIDELPSSPVQLPPPPLTSVEYPDAPQGAFLEQLQPCEGVLKTVPMFVNERWFNGRRTTHAYIVQHGAGTDFDRYFDTMYAHVNGTSLLVAPAFYKTNSARAPQSWYEASTNLAWRPGINQWPVGEDAADEECSSFDVFDTLLRRLSDRIAFPSLKSITFVGHSGGGNMVSRYAQINDVEDSSTHLRMRYVVMNAANQAYFTRARPWSDVELGDCPQGRQYPFQLTREGNRMPRYVAKMFDKIQSKEDEQKAATVFTRWAARQVVMLTGDRDTKTGGTQTCASQMQGGTKRRDRMYAFWTYQRILAGIKIDENEAGQFGLKELQQSGARALQDRPIALVQHQHCIVHGAGHDAARMLDSACGHAALFS